VSDSDDLLAVRGKGVLIELHGTSGWDAGRAPFPNTAWAGVGKCSGASEKIEEGSVRAAKQAVLRALLEELN
jgi:hypothetical protein